MLKGLFGLTPSHRFLYLQITLELEPISKMWIRVQVEPVEIGKKSYFIFRANGLNGPTEQRAQPNTMQ